MNWNGVWAIYRFEMARAMRTIWQSLVTPVLLTSLNFIIFGVALGSRIQAVDGVDYGSFLVPGLIMLSLLTQSVANASIGIYFPKFTGTMFELLSAPISAFEMVLGFVGAAATKSIVIGLVILATANLFVTVRIDHPVAMVALLVVTASAFALLGFIIGIFAKSFEQLNFVPTLVVTPLTFLGGVFYSTAMLPEPWRTVTLFNPVLYLVSAFRWSFFGSGDVGVGWSLAFTAAFVAACLGVIVWIFRTGYRLKP